MPRFTLPAFDSPAAQAAISAATAAATTLVRPARFPRWVRRGVAMSSTLTSVGMAMAGERRPASSRLADSNKAINVVDGRATSSSMSDLAAAATAGMGLVTSGLALRIDKNVEKMLLKRGVRHPRLWMAVGAAAISLVGPYVTKQIQASTARLQEKALPKETLESTLSDPLGTKQKSSAPAGQIESANTSRPSAGDDDERRESDEHTDH